MKFFSQIRYRGMGDGKRVSDGEIGHTYPLTGIDTHLLKYPFTIPYPIRNKKETNPGGGLTNNMYNDMMMW